jgi:3-hydroxyacyl-CoA dehydrogenase
MTSAVEKITKIVWKISEDAFEDGRNKERERIINLLEKRLTKAKDTHEAFGQITAMRIPVEFDQLDAITEAIIYAIKEEKK